MIKLDSHGIIHIGDLLLYATKTHQDISDDIEKGLIDGYDGSRFCDYYTVHYDEFTDVIIYMEDDRVHKVMFMFLRRLEEKKMYNFMKRFIKSLIDDLDNDIDLDIMDPVNFDIIIYPRLSVNIQIPRYARSAEDESYKYNVVCTFDYESTEEFRNALQLVTKYYDIQAKPTGTYIEVEIEE